MRGFTLTVLLGLMSCMLVSWKLLDLTELHYRQAISGLTNIENQVSMLNALTKEAVLQRQKSLESPPLGSMPPSVQSTALSNPKPAFKFLLIDEKSVSPDPECKACLLNPDKQEKLSRLLTPAPDTLYLYATSNDVMLRDRCSGTTKFSDCVQKYLNQHFDGTRLSINLLETRWANSISAKNAGAFVIISNAALTRNNFREIERRYGLGNAVGFHPN